VKVPFPVRVLPSLTFRAWLTPPPLGSGTASRDRASVADLAPVFFGGVSGYEIGSGPVALAVHGWGGRAAQMAAVARRLADAGFRVVVPDLPGRAGGPQTDIKQVAAAVQDVIEDVGAPEVVVGHSFASMALRLVFGETAPDHVVLMAPALDVNDALEVFGNRLRLLPWARTGLRRRLETWDPVLWPTLSHLHPTQFPGAEVLILHDPGDGETPFARSAELAAIRPGTSIIAVDGAGHSRILSNTVALDQIVSHVTVRAVGRESAA